jgi:NADH-quinone oxidoreductase subunit K
MGQITTLLVMGLAAAESVLVLAMIIVVYRRFGSTRTAELKTLQE